MKPPLDLSRFVEALENIAQVSALAPNPHNFDAAAGSPAEAEFAKQSPYAGPWSDEPLAETTMAGTALIYGAEDHLRAVGELIAGGRSRYGPLTLLRAAFELSARAWWIFDPVIDLEERLCRGANFTLDSHRELRKLEQEMGAPDTRTEKIQEILDTRPTDAARGHSHQEGIAALGAAYPKDTTSLCRLFMQDPAGPGADGLGAVMYRYLSATPHGTLHGLLRSSQPVPGVVAGKTGTLRSLELDPHEVAMLIAGVTVAYIFATDRQMLYFGWSGRAWDGWKLAVRDLIRPYLPDTPF